MKFKRNPYLDFYRSIAVISIIFIHTVFHSGERYVPHIFQTLALLIDVPFFMYLTGWSAIYNSSLAKAFLRIFRIISQWIFFVIFVNGVLLIFNYRDFNNFQDLFKAFLFMAYPDTLLPSIAWSIWYMPVYFKVLVIGNLLLCLVDFSNLSNIKIVFSLLVVLIALNSIGGGYYQTDIFYLFFFLLGYFSSNYSIKSGASTLFIICIIILSWITISFCLEVSPLNLQALKFPPSIIYGLASLISIVTSLFCKGRIDKYVNNKIINYIGTNAIWFYFCQGIGGSSLYYILPYFNLPWWRKLIIAFLINLSITFFCTMVVKHIYEFCVNLIRHVKSLFFKYFSNRIVPWNN